MRRDRGSATVEFALVLPAAVLALASVLAGARYGADVALASEAAATAARIALVDGQAAGERAGAAVVPGRVGITISTADGWWVAKAVIATPGPLPDAVAVARAMQP